MANDPPPPSLPSVPVVHTYTVVANRDNNPLGHATYTLERDGVPITKYAGMAGGWERSGAGRAKHGCEAAKLGAPGR